VSDSAETERHPVPPELASYLRLRGLAEIAQILGTHWHNVREMVETGELPCVRVGSSLEPKLSICMLEAWQRRFGALGAERAAPRGKTPVGRPRRRT
jgi:hypothetical protein